MTLCHRRRASHSADDAGLLSLLCRFDLAERPLVHPAREEDAVKVIQLVLHRPREESVSLDAHLLAMTVEPLGDDPHPARDLADPAGHGQATLETGLIAVGAHHLGIGELVDLVVDAKHDDA